MGPKRLHTILTMTRRKRISGFLMLMGLLCSIGALAAEESFPPPNRDVSVDQPLSELRGFTVRTIWLDDPDGITNYFAETDQSRDSDEPSVERGREQGLERARHQVEW